MALMLIFMLEFFRKLSGSFLLASRLGATIDTKAIWDKVVGKYTLG